MAKTRTKQKRKSQATIASIPVYEEKLENITKIFPDVEITRIKEINPKHFGRDYIVSVSLHPKKYTLKNQTKLPNGEITSITFSVQEKHCRPGQKPGYYRFVSHHFSA